MGIAMNRQIERFSLMLRIPEKSYMLIRSKQLLSFLNLSMRYDAGGDLFE